MEKQRYEPVKNGVIDHKNLLINHPMINEEIAYRLNAYESALIKIATDDYSGHAFPFIQASKEAISVLKDNNK